MNTLNTYKEQIDKINKVIDSIELYKKLVEVGEDHVRTMNGLGLEARDSIHSLDINQRVLNRLSERLKTLSIDLISFLQEFNKGEGETLSENLKIEEI